MPGRRTARKSGRRNSRRVSRRVSRTAKKSGRVTRGSARRSARRVSRRARRNTRRNTRRNVRRVRRSVRRMRGGAAKAKVIVIKKIEDITNKDLKEFLYNKIQNNEIIEGLDITGSGLIFSTKDGIDVTEDYIRSVVKFVEPAQQPPADSSDMTPFRKYVDFYNDIVAKINGTGVKKLIFNLSGNELDGTERDNDKPIKITLEISPGSGLSEMKDITYTQYEKAKWQELSEFSKKEENKLQDIVEKADVENVIESFHKKIIHENKTLKNRCAIFLHDASDNDCDDILAIIHACRHYGCVIAYDLKKKGELYKMAKENLNKLYFEDPSDKSPDKKSSNRLHLTENLGERPDISANKIGIDIVGIDVFIIGPISDSSNAKQAEGVLKIIQDYKGTEEENEMKIYIQGGITSLNVNVPSVKDMKINIKTGEVLGPDNYEMIKFLLNSASAGFYMSSNYRSGGKFFDVKKKLENGAETYPPQGITKISNKDQGLLELTIKSKQEDIVKLNSLSDNAKIIKAIKETSETKFYTQKRDNRPVVNLNSLVEANSANNNKEIHKVLASTSWYSCNKCKRPEKDTEKALVDLLLVMSVITSENSPSITDSTSTDTELETKTLDTKLETKALDTELETKTLDTETD